MRRDAARGLTSGAVATKRGRSPSVAPEADPGVDATELGRDPGAVPAVGIAGRGYAAGAGPPRRDHSRCVVPGGRVAGGEPIERQTHRGARVGRDRTEARLRYEARLAALGPTALADADHGGETWAKKLADTRKADEAKRADTEKRWAGLRMKYGRKGTGRARGPKTIDNGKTFTTSGPKKLLYHLRTADSSARNPVTEMIVDFKCLVPYKYFAIINGGDYLDRLVEARQIYGETYDYTEDVADEPPVLSYRQYRDGAPYMTSARFDDESLRNAIAVYNRMFFKGYCFRSKAQAEHESLTEAVASAYELGQDLADEGFYFAASQTVSKYSPGDVVLIGGDLPRGIPICTLNDAKYLAAAGVGEFVTAKPPEWGLVPGYKSQQLFLGGAGLIEGFVTWTPAKTIQVLLDSMQGRTFAAQVDPNDPKPWLDSVMRAHSLPIPDYYLYPIRDSHGALLRRAPSDRPDIMPDDTILAGWRLLGGMARGRSGNPGRGRGRSNTARGRGRGHSRQAGGEGHGQQAGPAGVPPQPARRHLREPAAGSAGENRGSETERAVEAGAREETLLQEVREGSAEEVADDEATAAEDTVILRARALEILNRRRDANIAHRASCDIDMYKRIWEGYLASLESLVENGVNGAVDCWGLHREEYNKRREAFAQTAHYFRTRFYRVRVDNTIDMATDVSGLKADAAKTCKYSVPNRFVTHLVDLCLASMEESSDTALASRARVAVIRSGMKRTRLAKAVAENLASAQDRRDFLKQAWDNPLTTIRVYGVDALYATLSWLPSLKRGEITHLDTAPMSNRTMYGYTYPRALPVARKVEPLCVGFPDPSKRIDPKHHLGIPTSLSCDVETKGRHGAEIVGPVFANPEVVNPCICGVMKSLVGRHLAPMPVATEHCFTEAVSVMCRAIAARYKMKVAELSSHRFVSIGKRLVETTIEAKKVAQSFMSWHKDRSIPDRIEAFMKNELGRFNIHDDPPEQGRIIQGHVNGATKLECTLEYNANQKAIGEVLSVNEPYEFKGRDGRPTGVFLSMASGATGDELSEWAKRVLAICIAVYERDAKTYDACINEEMTQIKLWLAQLCDSKFAEFMAKCVSIKGTARSKGGNSVDYEAMYTTKSGQGDTTSSNTLINAAITGNAMLRAGIKGYVLVAGDDMLMAITDAGGHEPAELKRLLMASEAAQGIIPKAALLGSLHAANFISGAFYATDEGPRFGPLIGRQAAKLNATVARIPPKKREAYKHGVAYCFKAFKNLPILSGILGPYGASKGGYVPQGATDYGAKKWMDQQSIAKDMQAGLRALSSRYGEFGISADQLMNLHGFLQSLNHEPLACSHPVASELMYYDMGLAEREEACPASYVVGDGGGPRPDHSRALRRFSPYLNRVVRPRDQATERGRRQAAAGNAEPGPASGAGASAAATHDQSDGGATSPRPMRHTRAPHTQSDSSDPDDDGAPQNPPGAGGITLAVTDILERTFHVIRDYTEQAVRHCGDARRQEVADPGPLPPWGSRGDLDTHTDALSYASYGVPPKCDDPAPDRLGRGLDVGSDGAVAAVGQYRPGVVCSPIRIGLPDCGGWDECGLPGMPAEPGGGGGPLQPGPTEHCGGGDAEHNLRFREKLGAAHWLQDHVKIVYGPHDRVRPVQRWFSNDVPVRFGLEALRRLPTEWGEALRTVLRQRTVERDRDVAVEPVCGGDGSEGWDLRPASSPGELGLCAAPDGDREGPRSGGHSWYSNALGFSNRIAAHICGPSVPECEWSPGWGDALVVGLSAGNPEPPGRHGFWECDELREHLPGTELRGDDNGDSPCGIRVRPGGDVSIPDASRRARRAGYESAHRLLRGCSAHAARVSSKLQRAWSNPAGVGLSLTSCTATYTEGGRSPCAGCFFHVREAGCATTPEYEADLRGYGADQCRAGGLAHYAGRVASRAIFGRAPSCAEEGGPDSAQGGPEGAEAGEEVVAEAGSEPEVIAGDEVVTWSDSDDVSSERSDCDPVAHDPFLW